MSEKKSRQVALLRGINVGGKNMLRMVELAKMFTATGCENVQTYIQSGNVIFEAASDTSAKFAEKISAKIEKKFGCKVPVVLRTLKEMEAIVTGNPFLEAGVAEDLCHVMFLADMPAKDGLARLDPARSAPDEYIVHGREIYLKLPNGVGRSKLTNAYFDSKLGTISTGRNWRTVLKLMDMMKEG